MLYVAAEWAAAGTETHALPALSAGTTSVTVDLKATKPQLWWPHELRPASQATSKTYSVNISLVEGARPVGAHGEFTFAIQRRVGFRVAELQEPPPKQGNGTLWQWRINGALLYVRGANIIPFDAFTTPDRVGRKQVSVIFRLII